MKAIKRTVAVAVAALFAVAASFGVQDLQYFSFRLYWKAQAMTPGRTDQLR